ncbi:hypothetical protein A2Z53_00845 [Candidatus Giovannonibacteria bacterium RIFCSPHIGHO2_02_42_15]|uniref:F5/8 type C domain-containing protein n=2 Tax=Candidatus Giovannoniibacteriota TaxID=1752738 RepID=A0A1F5VPJ6_9BACT|nr:MAG: hypothetical protein UV11_C0032G0001 [Candidatus Giovannonibacteria bacterium GW2011_GWF2_42_19]OGF65273.1 MAG: hypothetical protein A2Z53_00845 [Candidatus Giovannonibacteria bacterium RIFCSPHIGHO2_02_42_15]HBB53951.1 hypothetical protein [Candidatus Nomurabacteria bacterium]
MGLKSSANVTYLGLDFGTPKNIKGISLYAHTNTQKFIAKLQFSDDKTNWTDANVSVNIPVAPKNAANISFANNVAPETAKLKIRSNGFSRLNPIYGETRDAFVAGKSADGKTAMTKDFELLLKGALNAADARGEPVNSSQDAAALPFTSLTDALRYSAVVLSEHTSLSSAFIEQNIFTSALAASKVKIKADLKNIITDLSVTLALAAPVWQEASDSYTSANTAYKEIVKILKDASPELKPKIQAIAEQAALNLKQAKLAKNKALAEKNRINNAKTYAGAVFNNASSLSNAILSQAKSISSQTAVVMNAEGKLFQAANAQFAVGVTAAQKALNSTSAATQRKQLAAAAKNIQDTTKRMDGVFSTKTEPLYTQYVALAKQARTLAKWKTMLKKSVDSWSTAVNQTKAEEQKPKAEEALAKLKIARDETKANSQKVLDDLAAVKALIGTP